MPANARLLVHAGAPSTRTDDDRSRALLEAYLALGPTHISRRTTLSSADRGGERGLNHDHDAIMPEDATADPLDSTTFIDDTQLAYTALESQLFATLVRPARPRPTRKRLSLASPDPNSQVPNRARPEHDAPNSDSIASELERAAKKVRLSREHASAGNWSGLAHHSLTADHRIQQQTAGQEGNSNNDTGFSNDTTSELPTTYSLSDLASGSLKERSLLLQRSASDPGPDLSSHDETSDLLKSPQVPPARAIRERAPRMYANETAVSALKVSNALPREPPKHVLDPARLQATKDLLSLSTSIQPPSAVTSMASFTTHVTPALQHLASDSGLTSAFIPIRTAREIDPLERGHWLVKCTDWPPELQVKFWKTLETVIGQGNAGWGIWCSRGIEAPLVTSSQSVDSEQMGTEPAFGPIRIFCWGEVVKHVYLLLYVASSSKVRKLGLQWIDAEGLIVVQMQGTPGAMIPGGQ